MYQNEYAKQKDRIKKELQKINWGIVKKLMTFLYYNSKTKKTNIAMTCNMGYDKCILYLDWMKIMDLVEKQSDNGFELISLSYRGKDFFEKNIKNEKLF